MQVLFYVQAGSTALSIVSPSLVTASHEYHRLQRICSNTYNRLRLVCGEYGQAAGGVVLRVRCTSACRRHTSGILTTTTIVQTSRHEIIMHTRFMAVFLGWSSRLLLCFKCCLDVVQSQHKVRHCLFLIPQPLRLALKIPRNAWKRC